MSRYLVRGNAARLWSFETSKGIICLHSIRCCGRWAVWYVEGKLRDGRSVREEIQFCAQNHDRTRLDSRTPRSESCAGTVTSDRGNLRLRLFEAQIVRITDFSKLNAHVSVCTEIFIFCWAPFWRRGVSGYCSPSALRIFSHRNAAYNSHLCYLTSGQRKRSVRIPQHPLPSRERAGCIDFVINYTRKTTVD